MLASVFVFVALYAITYQHDPDARKNLFVATEATLIGLGVFGLWHLTRAPWLLDREKNKKIGLHWIFGVFGIVVMVGIIVGFTIMYRTIIPDAPQISFQSVAPPVVPVSKTSPRPTLKESPNSLRRRTLNLVNELNQFWSQRHQPMPPVQSPSTDEEKKRNAAWDKYWAEAGIAYQNAAYKERLLGIVREYKVKGISTGYMEQGFEQPNRLVGSDAFGGALDDCTRYMNDLCQIRELAYHVDAQDQPVFLEVKPQK
jgi:hypothetical protein